LSRLTTRLWHNGAGPDLAVEETEIVRATRDEKRDGRGTSEVYCARHDDEP
jgi:hypothetical protein